MTLYIPLLLLTLLSLVSGDIFDAGDDGQLDDYDDVWQVENIDDYKKTSHNFNSVNIPDEEPTATVPQRDSIIVNARKRRELNLAYDDEWMSKPEMLELNEDTDSIALSEREASDGGAIKFNTRYDIPRTLEPGDFIEVIGTYNKATFSINLKANNGHNYLHIGFRPTHTTVMNDALPHWGYEVRDSYPAFASGKNFKYTIMVDNECYRFFLNDELRSKTFPFRFNKLNQESIKNVAYVEVSGGGNGLKINKINMPGNKKHELYVNRDSFNNKISELKKIVTSKIAGRTLDKIKSYANSNEGSISLFKLELLEKIKSSGSIIDINNEEIGWLLNNREALEMLMTSGDLLNNNWRKAVKIVAEIIKQDPEAKEGLKLRLAVATGLTFAYPVHSQAIWSNLIDGIERYHQFVKWAKEKLFFTPFYQGTAWHLRYIVGSWQTNEELVWARKNILKDYKNEDKVADVTHKMIKYKLYNDDGVSVHSGAPYYYNKPITLEAYHKIGAVCGGISRFAVGMAQAHGVPALMVGQPGHCAYIWYRKGQWVIGNDISGWSKSDTHSYIQYSWKRKAPFFPAMDNAQKNLNNYRLSEKLRLAARFSDPRDKFEVIEAASSICPQNYAVWQEMELALEEPTLPKDVVHQALVNELTSIRKANLKKKNVVLEKPISSDCNSDSAERISSGVSHWGCGNTVATFTIDLVQPCSIEEIKINWWGWSKASVYSIYAADNTGSFTEVKTQKDEEVKGWFNHWSTIKGWSGKAYKLKMVMKEGKLDPWGYKQYFGIRQFQVFGFEHDHLVNVALKKPSTATAINDGNDSTIWKPTKDNSKVEIDLQKLTFAENVVVRKSGGSNGRILVEGGIGSEITSKDGSSGEVTFEKLINKALLKFDGEDYKVKEISILGRSYSVKEIFSIIIRNAYENIDYVKEDLLEYVKKIEFSY